MKPYRVLAKIQNNRLWAAVVRTFPDVKNQSDAAARLGVHVAHFGALLNLRFWPYTRGPFGKQEPRWSPAALHISAQLHEEPEYLFDGALYRRRAKPISIELDHQAYALLEADAPLSLRGDPDQEVMDEERQEVLRAALDSLRPREAEVIRLRFGLDNGVEHTIDEVSLMLTPPVSRERVRQIEAKALRTLRRPFPKYERLRDLSPTRGVRLTPMKEQAPDTLKVDR